MGDTDAAAHRLSEAEADRLAALDAERPPDLDDLAAIRARLPAPWELADAREWADRIRAERGWPATTADPTGDPGGDPGGGAGGGAGGGGGGPG